MNKKIFLAGLMLAAMSMNVSAQKKDGGISQQMLQQIKGSQSKGAADRLSSTPSQPTTSTTWQRTSPMQESSTLTSAWRPRRRAS